MGASDRRAAEPTRRSGGRAGAVWWTVVGALALAIGASLGAPPVASAALDLALARTLNAEQVRVEVAVWPPPALWLGRADVVSVAARNLRLGALRVRSLDATLHHIQMDVGALYGGREVAIRSLGSAVARFTVSQGALQEALGAQSSLRDAEIALSPGRVSLGATVGVLGVSVRAAGRGRLVLRGRQAVDLVLDRVTVGGVPVPAAIVAELTRGLNPVFDAGALPFGLRLTGVQVVEGGVVVDAAAGAQ